MKHTAIRRITMFLLLGILLMSLSAFAGAESATVKIMGRTFTFELDGTKHVIAGTHKFMSDGKEVTETLSDFTYAADGSTFSCNAEGDNNAVASWVFSTKDFKPLRNEWSLKDPEMKGVNTWDYDTNTYTDDQWYYPDKSHSITKKTIDTNRYISRHYEIPDNKYTEIMGNCVYENDGKTFAAEYFNSDGRVGELTIRVEDDGREIELHNTWVNIDENSHGESWVDDETGDRHQKRWEDNDTRYHYDIFDEQTGFLTYSGYWEYDGNRNLTWSDIRTNYVYNEDFTEFKAHCERFDGNVGTLHAYQVDDWFFEDRFEWTNQNGSHGISWADKNRTERHEERWEDNDTRYHYDIFDEQTGFLTYSGYWEYDGNRNLTWSDIRTNYVYNEDFTEYETYRECFDGRSGIQHAYWVDNWFFDDKYEWTNEDANSYGTETSSGDYTTNDEWRDGGRIHSVYTYYRENGHTVSDTMSEYDKDGNMLWSQVNSDFVYDDENGTFSHRYEHSNGTTGYIISRQWDYFTLSDSWQHEENNNHGLLEFHEEDGIYVENVWTISDNRLMQINIYTTDFRELSVEWIDYTDSLNIHRIRYFDGAGNITGMAVQHYAGDTLLISSEYNRAGDLVRVTRFDENRTKEYIIGQTPTMILPSDTRVIESQAFANSGAVLVYLPDGIVSLAADAFDSDALLIVSNEPYGAALCGSINHFFAVSHIDM